MNDVERREPPPMGSGITYNEYIAMKTGLMETELRDCQGDRDDWREMYEKTQYELERNRKAYAELLELDEQRAKDNAELADAVEELRGELHYAYEGIESLTATLEEAKANAKELQRQNAQLTRRLDAALNAQLLSTYAFTGRALNEQ